MTLHIDSDLELRACLPADLRGAATIVTKIAAGLSGAGVYRVDAEGRSFVLKVSRDDEPIETWQRTLGIQQLAANAGLAARIVHTDELRRAVLTDFIVDRSFFALFGDPAGRNAAIAKLGTTLRRVHDLALPNGSVAADPRAFLATVWSGLGSFVVPAFVRDIADRVRAEEPPSRERGVALCHNDVNPTNFVYDGENILLHDWNTAGPNDPLYDLATVAMFLRMDESTSLTLLSAHDGAPVRALPPGFAYNRRLVAVLCGSAFLNVARQSGHAGSSDATLESTLSLEDCYQRMRTGAMSPASADGQWLLGLALIKESSVTR